MERAATIGRRRSRSRCYSAEDAGASCVAADKGCANEFPKDSPEDDANPSAPQTINECTNSCAEYDASQNGTPYIFIVGKGRLLTVAPTLW